MGLRSALRSIAIAPATPVDTRGAVVTLPTASARPRGSPRVTGCARPLALTLLAIRLQQVLPAWDPAATSLARGPSVGMRKVSDVLFSFFYQCIVLKNICFFLAFFFFFAGRAYLLSVGSYTIVVGNFCHIE